MSCAETLASMSNHRRLSCVHGYQYVTSLCLYLPFPCVPPRTAYCLQRCLSFFSVSNLLCFHCPLLIPSIPCLLLLCSYSIPPSLPPPVWLLFVPCDRKLIPYMPSRLSSVSLLPDSRPVGVTTSLSRSDREDVSPSTCLASNFFHLAVCGPSVSASLSGDEAKL